MSRVTLKHKLIPRNWNPTDLTVKKKKKKNQRIKKNNLGLTDGGEERARERNGRIRATTARRRVLYLAVVSPSLSHLPSSSPGIFSFFLSFQCKYCYFKFSSTLCFSVGIYWFDLIFGLGVFVCLFHRS